ncbi:hypothetical protein [Kitasatospora sp. NPDC056731]|uniref:hypothetical protein n=1 Tax=Kitasatospora sp. NPDC056731 TaxID=3155422 RepID=UPI003430FD20
MTDKPGAQLAYEAYGTVTNFRNYQGNPMPAWADLPSIIRAAWATAESAVMVATVRDVAQRLATLGEPLDVADASDPEQVARALFRLLGQGDQQCVCGEPSSPDVVHRSDAPCHLDATE